MKKGLMFCFALILVLSISFTSAGFFGDFWNRITGQVSYDDSLVSKEIDEGVLKCVDSDGENIYLKGIVSYSGKKYLDFCLNSGIIKEYICEDDLVKLNSYNCPIEYKCEDGACIKVEKEAEKVKEDSDLQLEKSDLDEVLGIDPSNKNENKKNISKYSEKEVFLISDKNWKDVLSVVPVAVWTQHTSGTNPIKSKQTLTGQSIYVPIQVQAETIYKYPLLIYHEETEKLVDLISNATITASSSHANSPASYAIDGDLLTSWNSGNSNQAYLKLDLQEAKQFDRIDIFNLHDNYVINISVSLDGINYQPFVEEHVLSFGWNTFDKNVYGKYVKIVFNDNPFGYSNWKAINEIQIYNKGLTESYESFDADSIIYFMQQYNVEKVTIIGDSPLELDNLLIAQPELGVGLNSNQIKRISVNDYLSYWENFSDVVYVKNNYELSLMASTYASLINAPLIIQGTDLDQNVNLENKNIICVWNNLSVAKINKSLMSAEVISSHPPLQFPRDCDEKYTLEELQQKYVNETKTDKIILVNPNDLNIKVLEEFQPEKSANPVYELFTKTSLSSPILASAKHEVIISTTATDYRDIDGFIEDEINELFDSMQDAEYLTIVGSPNSIQMTCFNYNSYSLDSWDYSLVDEDNLLDLVVGRIFSITESDVSSNIARSLFYNKILKNPDKILVARGSPTYGIAADVYIMGSVLSEIGYNTTITPGGTQIDDWEDKFFISYNDHGSASWAGISSNEIPFLDSSIVITEACSTCVVYYGNSFCANIIRKGAIGYVGAVDKASFNSVNSEGFLSEIFGKKSSAGKSFMNSKKIIGLTLNNNNPMREYTFIGDPTFKIDPLYLLPQFKSTHIGDLSKKVKLYSLEVPIFKFNIPLYVQNFCQWPCEGHRFFVPNPQNSFYWAYFDLNSLNINVSKIDSIEISGKNISVIDTNFKGYLGIPKFTIYGSLKEGFNILNYTAKINLGEGNFPKKIYFQDINLENAVRNKIGKLNGTIYINEGLFISHLYLHYNQISNLSGIENLINLEYLNLDSNQISNLFGIENLINLEYLILHYNQISNLSGIENLVNLRFLHLYDNQISDISGIENLVNLRFLYLYDNQISDISLLLGLNNLKELYIQNNNLDMADCGDINQLINKGVYVVHGISC